MNKTDSISPSNKRSSPDIKGMKRSKFGGSVRNDTFEQQSNNI